MTIHGALANALSSLRIEQRQAELIANNIANASTPGYVRRGLPRAEQITGNQGTGVEAGALVRLGDATLEAAANQAGSAQAYSQRMVDVLSTYADTVGQPADTHSLPSTLSAFQKAMTSLSATPDNAVSQQVAVSAAQDLVDSLHALDAAVSGARVEADQGIAADVKAVNTALGRLAENEADLKRAAARGESLAPFQDTRASLISELSQYVPVKVFEDSNQSIIVTTDRGTTLWDGRVHELKFTTTPYIAAETRHGADASLGYSEGLFGVTVDGHRLASSENGRIAANLQLRDGTLPDFSRQLDQIAGNLIAAFQGADNTVTPAKPTGIFTAAGMPVTGVATETPGLARKIALNATVDPEQGGEAWRIRDGAQAVTPGLNSDNSRILGFVQAMGTLRSYDTATGMPGSLGLADATSQAAGLQQAALSQWTARNDTRTSQAQVAQVALGNQTGVSIDEELQRLMLVQQAHSAAAQVIQAAAKMLEELNNLR